MVDLDRATETAVAEYRRHKPDESLTRCSCGTNVPFSESFHRHKLRAAIRTALYDQDVMIDA